MIYKDYTELDSTSAEAKRVAALGETQDFVISTRRQTSGRGRYGRVWYASEDNVAMTISVPRPSSIKDFSTLSLMTGVALHEVLVGLIRDQANVRIKWPNDIVVDNAKISGTLIEIDATRIYVGIGVNLISAPSQTIFPTTSLKQFCIIDRIVLIEKIANVWTKTFQTWIRDGFSSAANVYTTNIWRLDEQVTIALNESRTNWAEGRCLGVDESGLLLLEDANGVVQSFSTGDVGA